MHAKRQTPNAKRQTPNAKRQTPNDKPEISFIVPVYNSEPYLEKCLISILNVDVCKEIIIINDGSTDNSLAICQHFAECYSEIRLISQPNQGLSASRNQGLKVARGEYVQFVDSDDYLTSNHYMSLLSYAKETKAIMVRGQHIEQNLITETFTEKQAILPINIAENVGRVVSAKQFLLALSAKKEIQHCWRDIYLRSFLLEHQIHFEHGFAEDMRFVLDVLTAQPEMPVLEINRLIYCYQRHLTSATQQRNNFALFKQLRNAAQSLKQRQRKFAQIDIEIADIIGNLISNLAFHSYDYYTYFIDEAKKAQAKPLIFCAAEID